MSRVVAAVVAWFFGIACLGASGADGVPSVVELVGSHAKLREYARSVQGHFSVYRDDSPESGRVLGDFDEIDLPLVMEGELWRDGSNYRLKGTQYKHVDGKPEMKLFSVATTPAAAYEFVSGADNGDAILRISAMGTSEYNAVREIGLHRIISRIDSLWSTAGRPIAEMLQRPDASIRRGGDGAIEIYLALGPNESTLYRLDAQRPYPIVEGSNQTNVSDSSYSMTYSVESSSDERGMVLPRRFIEEFTVGDSVDYTEVVVFELKANSDPDSLSQLDANSFRDMGCDYQVYRIKSDTMEEVGERIGGPQAVSKSSSDWTSEVFLAVALAAMCGVVFAIIKRKGS